MKQHQLTDDQVALDLTRTLWDRGAYAAAQRVWSDWLGNRAGDYLKPERVWNPRFELEPSASPFDWAINPPPSVHIERKNGLDMSGSL